MTRVGIDAHKKSCTTCVFGDDALSSSTPSETFVFKTTTRGVCNRVHGEGPGRLHGGHRVEHHRQGDLPAPIRQVRGAHDLPSREEASHQDGQAGRGADRQGGHARVREEVLCPLPADRGAAPHRGEADGDRREDVGREEPGPRAPREEPAPERVRGPLGHLRGGGAGEALLIEAWNLPGTRG